MTIPNIIKEWRKGCSCAPEDAPAECAQCTAAAITAIENEWNRLEVARTQRTININSYFGKMQLPPLGEASHFNRIGAATAKLIANGHSVEIVPLTKSMKDPTPISYSVKCPTLAFIGSVPLMDLAELLEQAVQCAGIAP